MGMNGHDEDAFASAFAPTEEEWHAAQDEDGYDILLAELLIAAMGDDDWAWALLCATTPDLKCPRCGHPVDVLDEAIVCPVCDEWWKDADAMARAFMCYGGS